MESKLNRQIQSAFDQRSVSYDGLDWVRDRDILNRVADLASPRPSDIFLDVATGTGAVAEWIAPFVAMAVGVDLSANMLRTCQATRGIAVQALAERLPFADEAFDLITCRNGLHHFCDPHVGIAEINRVARLGGRIVISESLVPDGPIRHFWRSIMRSEERRVGKECRL